MRFPGCRGVLVAIAVAFLVPACAAEVTPGASIGERSSAVVRSNGTELNGRFLNGRFLNGRFLNGRTLTGVSFSGVRLGDQTIASVWLDGGALRGKLAHGAELLRSDFAGAVAAGVLDDGTALPLRIDAVEDGDQKGLVVYRVSFGADDGWAPLCGTDDAGVPRGALALAGRWDYRQGVPGGGAKIDDPSTFTFACTGFALAKCVEMGYRPWATAKRCTSDGGCSKVSLAPWHQACTRMLRADYCGDGATWTIDGTPIDVYDDVGIQADTEAWSFEAEWTPNGARCVDRERQPVEGTPPCWPSLLAPDCGATSDFETGTLLMTEDAP